MIPESSNGAVLDWYDRHGRKDLPWQRGIIPYRVWVSGIMLQQTQVSTVLGYSNRFMVVLPDVETLVATAEDEVPHLWTGLGYYSHVRNLHKTAQIVVERHVGEFFCDVEQLAELSGIGCSTAGAITNLSAGLHALILDGNVRRILARYLAQDGYFGEPGVARALWEAVKCFTPRTRVDHYTQAVMDLGAVLCMRNKLSCLLCPLVSGCRTHLLGRETDCPQPKPCKALPQRRTLMSILANCGGAMPFYRRSSSGLWGGLWSLPELDDLDGLEPSAVRHSLALGERRELSGLTHTFSHFQLAIEPWLVTVGGAPCAVTEGDWLWCSLATPPRLGFAAPVKELLEHVEQELGRGTAA